MKRIFSVLAVVVLMAATLFSAPTVAFAQATTDQVTTDRHGPPFFACYKGHTKTFQSRHKRRDFLRNHNSAKIGPC